MNIAELLGDKNLKQKAKTETLSKWILDKTISTDDLIGFAREAKDSPKATCIEALEHATKQSPAIANEKCLQFATQALAEKHPRVKWESARVIGNIAPLFPSKLDRAVGSLLTNSEHSGTVVRWSAAFALGEILKLNTKLNKELIPTVNAIIKREEKGSIKKIYEAALKKLKLNK